MRVSRVRHSLVTGDEVSGSSPLVGSPEFAFSEVVIVVELRRGSLLRAVIA
jgi:hypothetical protein